MDSNDRSGEISDSLDGKLHNKCKKFVNPFALNDLTACEWGVTFKREL